MGFNKLKVLWLFAIFVQFGGYASSFDKTDRKISAHTTLQTSPTRTSFPGNGQEKSLSSESESSRNEKVSLGLLNCPYFEFGHFQRVKTSILSNFEMSKLQFL